MSAKSKQFKGLWGVVFVLSAVFVFWQDFDSNYENSKPGFIQLLERYWGTVKQELRSATGVGNFQASSQVQLIEPKFQNRSEFWLQDDFRQSTYEALKNFKGYLILNLDPEKLRSDAILKDLLQKEKTIRPVTFDFNSTGNVLLERYIGRHIDQPPLSLINRQIRVLPNERPYYSSAKYFGALMFTIDDSARAAQFISNYPLAVKASRFFLPSVTAETLRALGYCDKFSMPKASEIECWKEGKLRKRFENPVDLYLYDRPYPRLTNFDQIKNSAEQVLIFSPVDASSSVTSVRGQVMSWGDLVATNISNIVQAQEPWRDWRARVFEIFLLIALVSALLFFVNTQKTRTAITASIIALATFAVADILFYLFSNAKTSPIEEFFALSLIALTGISVRSLLDFQERSLIERAFRGYVSEERLERLLKGREKLSLKGRHREMTTLLLDIAGFSKISAELGAERTFEFTQKFFARVDPEIFKQGGTIDKKTGDGLLAFFGDFDGEDRPQEAAVAAVRSALAIQRKLKSSEKPIDCRIGVNSGDMMIGNTGSRRHFNYTVLGEVVNFTQRLEAACPAGSVLVGESTAELVRDFFELQELEISVKNEAELSRAFEVLGEKRQ